MIASAFAFGIYVFAMLLSRTSYVYLYAWHVPGSVILKEIRLQVQCLITFYNIKRSSLFAFSCAGENFSFAVVDKAYRKARHSFVFVYIFIVWDQSM
jgi:hypothetical protein